MTSIRVEGSETPIEFPRRGPVWIMAAAIVVVVGLAMTRDPLLVRFWAFSPAEFVQTMTPFLLVSLFVERALEILVKGFYGEGEAILRRAAKDKPEVHTALVRYKEHTRRFAFTAGVLICVAIAGVGLRIMEQLADPAEFALLSNLQRTVFQTIDVLLTGTLLAGGADGMHKLVNIATNAMDAKNQKLRDGV
jgi:hypothetical protein